MPSYYEILKVSPTAAVAEIHSAYKAQCAQLERLVNHPNAQTINRAQQGLQFLQQVFATLSDTEKRKAYDASLGLIAGLADPQAALKSNTSVPPAPPVVAPSPAPVVEIPVDAWVCPACQTFSPIDSRFCKACGQTLARECPQCDELVETTATFCSVCGFDLKGYMPPLKLHTVLTAVDRKLIDEINKQLEQSTFSNWRSTNLMTPEVTLASQRGLVVSLGMVKKNFSAQFSLSLQCEQPVKVQIASDNVWLAVNQSSLTLEANRKLTTEVTLDTSRLEGGQFYTGVITIAVLGDNPITIKHYVMFGVKKFLGAGDAKDELKFTVPAQLESIVLGTAFVESMIREARQATIDGNPAKSAAAYANVVWALTKLQTDSSEVVAPYTKSTSRITALAQRWHRLAQQLLDNTETSPPGLGWLNWDPQVRWIEPIPFHFLPLWEVERGKCSSSTITSGSSGKILYPLDAELAVDCLTGEPQNAQQALPVLSAGDGGISPHSAAEIASDGDFVVRIDKKHLIATQGKRSLWQSKVGYCQKIIIGQRHVYSYDGSNILTLDRSNGKQVWKAEFNQRTYYTLQIVEVSGILIAMYMSLFSAGNATNDSHYVQHLRWWDADTGNMQKTFFPVGRGKDVGEFKVCYAVSPVGSTTARVVSAYKNHIYDMLIFRGQPTRPEWGTKWVKADACLYQEHTYVSTNNVEAIYLRMLGQHTCLVTDSRQAGIFGTAQTATFFDLQTQRQSSGAVGFPWRFSATTVGGVLILHSKGRESNDTVSAYV